MRSAKSQMKRVRHASMVARDPPLSCLVTLMPDRLKAAMDVTVVAVVHCSVRLARTSCARV